MNEQSVNAQMIKAELMKINDPKVPHKPKMSDWVEYRLDNGFWRPALVVFEENEKLDLQVFTRGQKDSMSMIIFVGAAVKGDKNRNWRIRGNS